jgi:hypothetical protein
MALRACWTRSPTSGTIVVPGFFTVSTSQPGSQYSTRTQGVDGLQKHGPVIFHETQARFTMPVKLGALALAWLL